MDWFSNNWIQKYQDLSLKWKIPLRSIMIVLLSASIISSTLIYLTVSEFKSIYQQYVKNMVVMFSGSLSYSLLYDDPWHAYMTLEQITSKHLITNHNQPILKINYLLILDQDNRVFVSSHPKKFPILSNVNQVAELKTITNYNFDSLDMYSNQIAHQLLLAAPIKNDAITLGTFIISLATSPLSAQLYRMILRIIILTFLTLIPLTFLVIIWSRKIANPLIALSNCMSATDNIQAQRQCFLLPDSKDEIGQLILSFNQMLSNIKKSAQLEAEFHHSERFAALGRMASGIAHEVNNPLGGMLNAIQTYRKLPKPSQDLQDRTFNLLERGLLQIQDTVSALLVQAKYNKRALQSMDFNDVFHLVKPKIKEKNLTLQHNQSTNKHQIGKLPAHPIRQIMINLILNAINASENGGVVQIDLQTSEDFFQLEVSNSGKKLTPERLKTLFEPDFKTGDLNRQGFGLWISYQLIKQLQGEITVTSENITRFTVTLPFEKQKILDEDDASKESL